MAGPGPILPPWIWFFIKSFAVFFVMMWIKFTMPRFRIDQLMAFNWKFLVPLSLVNLLILAVGDTVLKTDGHDARGESLGVGPASVCGQPGAAVRGAVGAGALGAQEPPDQAAHRGAHGRCEAARRTASPASSANAATIDQR